MVAAWPAVPLSLNPESGILRSADLFYRRGRTVLVFAKFVPVNTIAALLAGSMNMRFGQFAGLDFTGASLYVAAYLSVGFLFSDALGTITKNYAMFSRALSSVSIAASLGYLGFKAWIWIKADRVRGSKRLEPTRLSARSSLPAGV
jgi:membrane protein DedA with SNARE-associated domain